MLLRNSHRYDWADVSPEHLLSRVPKDVLKLLIRMNNAAYFGRCCRYHDDRGRCILSESGLIIHGHRLRPLVHFVEVAILGTLKEAQCVEVVIHNVEEEETVAAQKFNVIFYYVLRVHKYRLNCLKVSWYVSAKALQAVSINMSMKELSPEILCSISRDEFMYLIAKVQPVIVEYLNRVEITQLLAIFSMLSNKNILDVNSLSENTKSLNKVWSTRFAVHQVEYRFEFVV